VNRKFNTIYVLFGEMWMIIPAFLMAGMWLWRMARSVKRNKG